MTVSIFLVADIDPMADVTRILSQIDSGQPGAEELLPLVYDELRKLAAARLAQEKPGQTLQATALVHEAYLRLLGRDKAAEWANSRHFFAAAAEAMRRILVESARRKGRIKHGGDHARADGEMELIAAESTDPLLILAVNEALERLAARSPRKGELVKLRYFAGCTLPEAAKILDISLATAEEDWAFARAWLQREWNREDAGKHRQASSGE
jgi:RNA polymerase sigma factor (TIGR02999 family)